MEVVAGVDAQAPAVFQDGVEDGAALAGIGVAEEQPVLLSQGGGADGILDEVVVDLQPPVIAVAEQLGPEGEGVGNGTAHRAGRAVPGQLEP